MSPAFVTKRSAAVRRVSRVLRRPRSIRGLVLTSFVLVATPLMLAIVAGVIYVNRLNKQSERLIMQGVTVTRESKQINNLLIRMERTARQYRILGDDDLVRRFDKQAEKFNKQLYSLARLDLDTVPNWNLTSLRKQVRGFSDQIGKSDEKTDRVIKALNGVHTSTRIIANQGAAFVDKELDRLQATAQRARLVLSICVFALIPATIALGLFLAFVITRPLRQILEAVGHLGTADFSRPISIVAPAVELDRLGERLDWMRQRLATIDQEKQQFIRHMSHELKTPLASIREGTELLADGSAGGLSDEQREVTTILQSNSQELAILIDNLLNFAAWQQQRAGIDYSEFDLGELIARVVSRQKLTISARNLDVRCPRTAVPMMADVDRIQLIIDNLLANAVKYSPTGSTIRIDAERDKRGVDVYVADDGPGVDGSERERVFEAFVRGSTEPAGASGVKGTGIGLSVVRDCARAHGGDVAIIDRNGKTSVFHVHIPAFNVSA